MDLVPAAAAGAVASTTVGAAAAAAASPCTEDWLAATSSIRTTGRFATYIHKWP